MKKNDFFDIFTAICLGLVLLCMLFFTTAFFNNFSVKAADFTVSGDTVSGDTVSGDIVSGDTVSGDTVSGDTVSGNIVISGNTISGNFITSDQGESIIFYLRLILFLLLFSFCWERIRNGIRSLNKMR